MSGIPVARFGGAALEIDVNFRMVKAPTSGQANNWEMEGCVATNPCFYLPETYETIYFVCGFSQAYHKGYIKNDVLTVESGEAGGQIMLDDKRRLRCMGSSTTYAWMYTVTVK